MINGFFAAAPRRGWRRRPGRCMSTRSASTITEIMSTESTMSTESVARGGVLLPRGQHELQLQQSQQLQQRQHLLQRQQLQLVQHPQQRRRHQWQRHRRRLFDGAGVVAPATATRWVLEKGYAQRYVDLDFIYK